MSPLWRGQGDVHDNPTDQDQCAEFIRAQLQYYCAEYLVLVLRRDTLF